MHQLVENYVVMSQSSDLFCLRMIIVLISECAMVLIIMHLIVNTGNVIYNVGDTVEIYYCLEIMYSKY